MRHAIIRNEHSKLQEHGSVNQRKNAGNRTYKR